MSQVDRTKIIAGPAIIKRGTLYMRSQGDVTLTLNAASFNVELEGEIWDERDDDTIAEIKFTPLGVFNTAHVTELYPHLAAAPGDMVFPGVDEPIVIWGRDGKKKTFACAAVTAMPALKLAANAQLYGEVTYSAIRGNDKAASVADSFYTEATEALPAVTVPSRADVITMPYAFSLGGAAAPWDNIVMADGGVDVSFDVQTEDVVSDAVGLVQRIIKSVRATASFTPLNVGAEDLLGLFKVQGAGAVRGRSRYLDAKDFIATGGPGNPRFVLSNALPVDSANVVWGAASRRAGQVQLRSVRDVDGNNAWTPAATLTTEPVE